MCDMMMTHLHFLHPCVTNHPIIPPMHLEGYDSFHDDTLNLCVTNHICDMMMTHLHVCRVAFTCDMVDVSVTHMCVYVHVYMNIRVHIYMNTRIHVYIYMRIRALYI